MAEADSGPKFDHVVSVMFENRSFDNLLGRLYEPGEVASFEGVIGKELANPIPDWAEHAADRKVVPDGVAAGMDSPHPESRAELWQRWTNGSCCHAASSSGLVVNAPYDNFPLHNDAETIFERLDAAGLPWRVYVDPGMPASVTGAIHAPRLERYFAANFSTLADFFDDAER